MRNAIVKMPTQRSIGEHRQVLGAAVRQLDRAEIYLAAVAYMDLGDHAVDLTVNRLRSDVDGIRRYLIDRRDVMRD
ncbi:MAG TPA: hypothetical protein VND96_04345 [Candidatus Micrarchaeaceae archaeon]|nr:hypothetical protein [Candidatus Micrarchaeaceae archaeon]